jgi:D-alanyl-D-alanine carboxypeptidase
MRMLLGWAALLMLGAVSAAAAGAQSAPEAGSAASEVSWGGAPPERRRATAITDLAKARGLKGEIAIDAGGMSITSWVSPDMVREGYVPLETRAAMWPFASITKQKLAARLLPELATMGFTLDTPVSRILPRWAKGPAAPTIRQLLQHRSGLRNPEDTPKGANGWPAFYNEPAKHGLSWCMNGRAAPPASGWAYNNCDYIVLGAVLEEVSLETVEHMLGAPRDDAEPREHGTMMITPANAGKFYAMKSPENEVIPAYGASAALGGPLIDVVFFNWGQMKAYKDGVPALKPLWQGDPELGYMALGQWVFEVQPPGCTAPVKVAERKGEIGQYRLSNIMLPDLGRSMVFATIDPAFEFGEIWQGEGFMAEAVGMLACDKET